VAGRAKVPIATAKTLASAPTSDDANLTLTTDSKAFTQRAGPKTKRSLQKREKQKITER
jgi:hypothetical protein